MGTRPEIPAGMKRAVRRKAYWGCCMCGNPLIQYHHIIPWSKVHEHTEDNLIALCPNCHSQADHNFFHGDMLKKAIENPHNKDNHSVHQKTPLMDYDHTVLRVGGNNFSFTNKVLRCNDLDLITLKRGEDGTALLSAKFFDCNGSLLAEIVDNEWIANTDVDLWDIQYHADGHLKINLEPRNIMLDLRKTDNALVLEGVMYAYGMKVVLSKDEMFFNSSRIRLSGNSFYGVNGICFDTAGSYRIGWR